jgi:2-phosphosulfolactate phosphatase
VLLAPIRDVLIIANVLSFSITVEIATGQGAIVFPYRWKDETAYDFAVTVNAEVADKGSRNCYSLSPTSLLNLPSAIRLVLPSPNASTLSLPAGATLTIAGCFRNCEAVATSAMNKGSNIAVIPAGESWEDGTLRPCVEDLVGAGAIISFLQGTISPEAKIAVGAFEKAAGDIFDSLKSCSSGKEKISRDEENDIKLVTQLNMSSCVLILSNGAFVREA